MPTGDGHSACSAGAVPAAGTSPRAPLRAPVPPDASPPAGPQVCPGPASPADRLPRAHTPPNQLLLCYLCSTQTMAILPARTHTPSGSQRKGKKWLSLGLKLVCHFQPTCCAHSPGSGSCPAEEPEPAPLRARGTASSSRRPQLQPPLWLQTGAAISQHLFGSTVQIQARFVLELSPSYYFCYGCDL